MNVSSSWLRSIAVVLIGTVVLLVVVYFSLGRDAAEKIGTALFMPSGIVWLMLIALCIQLWPLRRSDRPAGGWTSLLCLAAYSLGGSGYISDFMASSLEAPYVQINPLTEPPVDIVVVLGGGGSQGANGRLQGNGSGDRMILAAQLYHKDPATKRVAERTNILSCARPDKCIVTCALSSVQSTWSAGNGSGVVTSRNALAMCLACNAATKAS